MEIKEQKRIFAMTLKLNENYVKDFIRDDEYAHIQPMVNAAHELLTSKTGAGNDFLGWTTLPFDYDKKEFEQIKKIGNMEQLVGMMPGVKPGALKDAKIDEKAIGRTEAIIKSMTRYEREKPDMINASRKKRIAAGSGTSVEEVNKLLRQYDQIRKLMKQFANPKSMSKMRRGKMKIPF